MRVRVGDRVRARVRFRVRDRVRVSLVPAEERLICVEVGPPPLHEAHLVRVRVRVRVGVKPTNFSSKESALTPRDAAALILAGRPFFQH